MTPFNVVWYFGEAREGTKWKPLTLPQLMSGRDVDSDVTYEITDVTDNSEGYYKCLIETSRGTDEGITYLDVEEQPPLIDAPDTFSFTRTDGRDKGTVQSLHSRSKSFWLKSVTK